MSLVKWLHHLWDNNVLVMSKMHQYIVQHHVCSDSDNISFTYTEHIVPFRPQWENQGMFLVGVHLQMSKIQC